MVVLTYSEDMALSVVLVALALATAASSAPEHRVVGGEPTNIENFPYIVSLTYLYPGPGITVQRCVGCLLSSWHVMTTAFCFTGAIPENFRVRAGSTNSLSGGTLVPLDRIIKHPDYVEIPREADMAITFMASPLGITSSINVLYLPPQGIYIPDGTETTVVSWGFEYVRFRSRIHFIVARNGASRMADCFDVPRQVGGPQLELLKTIKLYKMGLEECLRTYADKEDAVKISDTVICANAPGRGMCAGDSGAPMVTGQQTAAGIFSFFYECGNDDVPDVFTRVDRYTNWILSVATTPTGYAPVRVAA